MWLRRRLGAQHVRLDLERDALNADGAFKRHVGRARLGERAHDALGADEADIHRLAGSYGGQKRNQPRFREIRGRGWRPGPEEHITDAQRDRSNMRREALLDAARQLRQQPIAKGRHVRLPKSAMKVANFVR